MLSGEQLLDAFDSYPPQGAMCSSGVSELDDITGGPQGGHLWLITGGVGEGKTTLLTQVAVAAASNGHATQLVCPRETAAWTTRRMLSGLGPAVLDLRDRDRDNQDQRLSRARHTLAALPLRLVARDTAGFTPEIDPYAAPAAAAVVVDDADMVGGMTPSRVARYADEGRFVAITLPRSHVFEGPGDRAPLREMWVRVSDVVLEVRTRTMDDTGSRGTPGRSPAGLRPGEADLIVHRNRWGHTRTLMVAEQFHYARFKDLPPG